MGRERVVLRNVVDDLKQVGASCLTPLKREHGVCG